MSSGLPARSQGAEQPSATRILVADDALSGRELLRSILDRRGYEVLEASNGAEVIEKAETFQPHLFILDLQMPKVDGYTAVMALRKIPAFQKTPVIALAASLPEVSPERIRHAGFSCWLIKPLNPARLRENVMQLLQEDSA